MNGERWAYWCTKCEPPRRVFLMSAPSASEIPKCAEHGKMERQQNAPYRRSQVASQRIPKLINQDVALAVEETAQETAQGIAPVSVADQETAQGIAQGIARRLYDQDQLPPAVKAAAEFLRDKLADGPKLATEIKASAANMNIGLTTLMAAKAALGVEAHKTSSGPWEWTLT